MLISCTTHREELLYTIIVVLSERTVDEDKVLRGDVHAEEKREKIFPRKMTTHAHDPYSSADNPSPCPSLPTMSGQIILFDTRTCWAIIAPFNGSRVIPGKITTFSVPHHLHLHSSVSLIVGKEYDETAYEYDMDYDLTHESDPNTYKRIILYDSVNKFAVLTNGSGRLKLTTYANSRNIIPYHAHLPEHCQLVLHECL